MLNPERARAKIMALGLAGVMMLGMSTAVFAAGDLGNDAGVTTEKGVYEGSDTTISLKTAVVITNNETTEAAGKVINYPAMSFTHTIAPATIAAKTTVTDEKNVTVDVKAGVPGGATVSETGISAGKVTLNARGQEVVFATTNVNIDLAQYTAPGIYRYAITDTSTATGSSNLTALQTAGVVKGSDVDDTYFLDVYIKRNTETNTLTVAGAVLTSENTVTITHEGKNKESGFDEVKVITETTTDSDTEVTTTTEKLDPSVAADLTKNYSYTTYNVTLTKAVKGAMGDQDHAFPFAVAVTSGQNYGYEVTGSHVTSHNVAYTSDTTISSASLDDGATLKIWGLTPFATVNYTETNDTSSTYKVKVGTEADGTQIQAEADVAGSTGTKAAWSAAHAVADGYAIDTTATLNADADEVYFTNTLNEISPTGVVMRFAPYLIMLAGAIVLVMVTRRRKAEER